MPARLAPSRARSVADPDLLFSVVAVRAGVYHAGFRGYQGWNRTGWGDPRAKMSDVGECVPSPEQPVDRALIERARGGDRDAYAEVATLSSHRLYAVALRVLRDPDAASDALQAALVRIWRDLPALRDPDLYDAWSSRVLMRACSDTRRRALRSVRTIDLVGIEGAAADSQSVIAVRDELERAFATLSVNQRTVLVLMYYEGQSVAQIAATLDISSGTVKSRLHGARNAMRAAIDADSRLHVRTERPA